MAFVLLSFIAVIAAICNVSQADYRFVYLNWGCENDGYQWDKYSNRDEAINAWLAKDAHTKILYDWNKQNPRMFLAHSVSGRVGTVLGYVESSRTAWFQDRRLSRGFKNTDTIFSCVYVLASHRANPQEGRGVLIEKVSTTVEEIEQAYHAIDYADCKIVFEWRHSPYLFTSTPWGAAGGVAGGLIYGEIPKDLKFGPQPICDEVVSIVRAIDEGQLFCQAYMPYIVSWVRNDDGAFRTADCLDRDLAQKLFDHLPKCFTKMAFDRNCNKPIAKHSSGPYPDQEKWLEWATRTLNTVFPMGTWAKSSKHAKSWFDINQKRHVLRANLGNSKTEGEWCFDHRYNWYNAGRLTQGND